MTDIVRSTGVVAPLGTLQHRLPEQGRLRLGEKGKKGEPRKLNKFRLTSHDKDALDKLAAVPAIGGTVREWPGGPRGGEYELYTNTTRLRIALPPEPLSQHYELWKRGGCERRCDGVTYTGPATTVQTPDGAEQGDAPCACDAQGKLLCKPTTRLTVILLDAPFGGGWLLTTGGWYAAKELPGMVGFIQAYGPRNEYGLTTGELMLKEVSQAKGGQTRKWMVPTLVVPYTIEQIMTGEAQLGALAAGAQVRDAGALAAAATMAINAPAPAARDEVLEADASIVDLDDEPATAELVDDEHFGASNEEAKRSQAQVSAAQGKYEGQTDSGIQAPLKGEQPGPKLDSAAAGAGGATGSGDSLTRMRSKLHALVGNCTNVGANKKPRGPAGGVDPDKFRHALIRSSLGYDSSSNDLAPDELAKVLDLANDVLEGRRRFGGIDAETGLLRLGERTE